MKCTRLFILIALAFIGCKDNIADKDKKNENWVWWVDTKTGKAQWVPYEGDGITAKNGKYTRFYFNGNKYCSGRLVAGADADTVFYYDMRGNLFKYEVPKADSLDYFIHNGPTKMFYPDGKIAASGIVKNHTYGDKWISYFKNGQPDNVRNLKNDTGWVTIYYDNGNVRDSDYFEGEKSFNIKHWYDFGQLQQSQEFKNGDLNGLIRQYYPSGKLHKIGVIKNGRPYGMVKAYYEDGNIYSTGNEVDGILNGLQMAYYENGNIWITGNVKNGKLDGEIKKYDKNGKLILDRIYKNGELIEDKISSPYHEFNWFNDNGLK
jgi:antitoxin component YwqK of YwqJK toxin-antitoxin module